MEQKSSGERFVVALILFGAAVLIAILLVLTALLVWLTQWIGSLALAAAILGAVFAAMALAIYLAAIRKPLERLRAQAETVYEVARAARSGYEWVLDKVALVLRLRGGSAEAPRNAACTKTRCEA